MTGISHLPGMPDPDATILIPEVVVERDYAPEPGTPDPWGDWVDTLKDVADFHWFDMVEESRHVRLRVWYGPDRAACTAALTPFVEAARRAAP